MFDYRQSVAADAWPLPGPSRVVRQFGKTRNNTRARAIPSIQNCDFSRSTLLPVATWRI